MTPFAGKFQHQVAAHGKTDQRQAGNLVLLYERMRNGGNILRAAGMIQRGRKVVRSTAISLVHANYIHARGQAFAGKADCVARIAGTFEAVDHQQS